MNLHNSSHAAKSLKGYVVEKAPSDPIINWKITKIKNKRSAIVTSMISNP